MKRSVARFMVCFVGTAALAAHAAEPAKPKPAAPQAAASSVPMNLTCDNPAFGRTTTVASLRQQFGAKNVKVSTDEGQTSADIFANDPKRAIEATFGYDQNNKLQLVSVTARSSASVWRLPGGLKMGDSLEAVETYNGKPFHMWGFGGNNVGTADGFDGVLQGAENSGCTYYVAFAQKADKNPDARDAQSDDPAVRALKPVISMFGIHLASPEPAQ